MGFSDKFKKKHDEEQQNSPPAPHKTGGGKQAEKRIKQQQKQKVRQKKADQALLKSALTFSKDIQKLAKKLLKWRLTAKTRTSSISKTSD